MTLRAKTLFTPQEYAARRRVFATELERRGLRGALLFRQESLYYLTGFDSFGYVFFQCLYFHGDGRMILLTRAPDLRQAQLTSVLADSQIQIWGDRHGARPEQEAFAIVGRFGGGKKIGIERDAYGLTAALGLRVDSQAAASGYKLQDISDMITRQRVVKSAGELRAVRRAARLADDALDAGVAQTRPGANEGAILAAMQGAVFAGGGDYPGNDFIVGGGDRALLCRSYTGRQRLAKNDQLTLEYAGAYRHYHAALMRCVLVGKPKPKHLSMHAAAADAFFAAKEQLRPGEPVGKAFDAHARVLDAAGLQEHRLNACGYSLGATFAPTWMDKPMLYHGNPEVARPGMVFFIHIILADSKSKTAMSTGETVVVGERGARGLSRHRHTLIRK